MYIKFSIIPTKLWSCSEGGIQAKYIIFFRQQKILFRFHEHTALLSLIHVCTPRHMNNKELFREKKSYKSSFTHNHDDPLSEFIYRRQKYKIHIFRMNRSSHHHHHHLGCYTCHCILLFFGPILLLSEFTFLWLRNMPPGRKDCDILPGGRMDDSYLYYSDTRIRPTSANFSTFLLLFYHSE